jgi:hypothetical protein
MIATDLVHRNLCSRQTLRAMISKYRTVIKFFLSAAFAGRVTTNNFREREFDISGNDNISSIRQSY